MSASARARRVDPRLLALLGWLALVALGFGPRLEARPDQTAWILRLLTGAWDTSPRTARSRSR